MGFKMSRKTAFIPSSRRHRASGQAVVTLNGVDHYLGPWNSPESRAAYDRITQEWLACGRRLPDPDNATGGLFVKQLVNGYHTYLCSTLPKIEHKIRLALKAVREMYGETQAAKFGAVSFKAIRLKMIESDLAITTIRDRMGVIRRMVAWGVENEMLPADSLQRIEAVAGLRVGRDGVKPSRKVKPAPDADIEAILPHVPPTIRAMIELQRLTGMNKEWAEFMRQRACASPDNTSDLDPWIPLALGLGQPGQLHINKYHALALVDPPAEAQGRVLDLPLRTAKRYRGRCWGPTASR